MILVIFIAIFVQAFYLKSSVVLISVVIVVVLFVSSKCLFLEYFGNKILVFCY